MTGAAYIPAAKREDWQTPDSVVALVREAFGGAIDLDPCASPNREDWIAARNLNPADGASDGLASDWTGRVYVNPPFGALRQWAARCEDQHRQHGAEVVLLCPARTDTRAWHNHIASASAICLWRGRMTFKGAPSVAPFPVTLSYWGPNHQRFRFTFSPFGMVVRP